MDPGFTKAMGYGHPAGPGRDPGFADALVGWAELLAGEALADDPTAHFIAWTEQHVLAHDELLGRTPTPGERAALEDELDLLERPGSVRHMLHDVGGGGFVVVPPSARRRWVRHDDDVDYVAAVAASPDGATFTTLDIALPGYAGRQDAGGRDPSAAEARPPLTVPDRGDRALASEDAYPAHRSGDHPAIPLVVEAYLLWSGICRDGPHVHSAIRPAIATFWRP